MNIVDIILLLLFASSIFFGYRRGLLHELYDLGALLITLLLAFLLRGIATNYLNTYINFKAIFHLKIDDAMYQLIMNFLGTILGFTYAFILLWIVIKMVILILIKEKIIPIRTENYNWGGSIISFLKAVLLATIIAFTLSFSFLIKQDGIYENSLMAKPLLELNGPLNRARNNVVQIYEDAKSLSDIVKVQGSLTDSKEIIDVIKSVKNNPIITDELIIEVSKTAIKNDKIIDMSNLNIEQFKTNLKQDSNYPILKTLYDEKVITNDLIYKILEANKITGITKENIQTIFEWKEVTYVQST